jgi:hypothetical protein
VPDYRKPEEDVFRDATRVALTEVDDFRPWQNLSHRCEEDLLSNRIPSWALKMDQTFDADHDPSTMDEGFSAHRGRHYSERRNVNFTNSDTLSARGICVGKVVDATAIVTEHHLKDNVKLMAWTNEVVAKARMKPDENAIPYSDIAAALMAGKSAENHLATREDELDFFAFIRALEGERKLVPEFRNCTSATPSYLRAAAKFKTAMRFGCKNRRVFITNTNYIGVGPKLTRTGDVIVVLYGGQVPLALRPCGETYRVLGECYVAGVMEGEAVRKHNEEGRPDIEFRIQ